MPPTTQQKLLFGFIFFNVVLVVMNVSGEWQHLRSQNNKMVSLAILNATTNAPKTLNDQVTGQDLTSLADAVVHPKMHPFDRLPKLLEQLDHDPVKVDDFVRQHWNAEHNYAEKTFLRYRTNSKKQIITYLSTSCLHNAAWIVPGLLELQTRPNIYYGLYEKPKDKNLIVYDNTNKPPMNTSEPLIQNLTKFINSRPKNESIVLQFDMYEILPYTGPYVDHHWALHIYNDSVALYQGWQHNFNVIQWMKEPNSYKLRYPMPLETFLAHFARFLNYTEDREEMSKRLDSIWALFGVSEANTYSEKGLDDPDDIVVWPLKFPWVVSLVTHWPHPTE